MSPATSLAKPLVKPITQCPYCDHVSPVGSKFCGECGAALHLMPCPHCGAVNDITVTTACYRCHGELRKDVAAALPAPAAPEPSQTHASPYAIAKPPARQRPHALVVVIVLSAFAAASYYAFRQRSELDVREPARADMSGRATAAENKSNTGTITKAPSDAKPIPATPTAAAVGVSEKAIDAGKTAAVQVEAKAARTDAEPPREAATGSNAGKPAAGREATASPAAAPVTAPEIARARAEAIKGLDQHTPNIGPCTDAIAALGLCSPETTPRRQ